MNFHPDMTEIKAAYLANGQGIGWTGKIGEGYTWVVPNGLMSLDPHSGGGNFESREMAIRMLQGMYTRPEPYGFKREDWN